MPEQPGCPCFGDQPLLGADKYGIYITTNEFSILGPEFNGAQMYAICKSALFGGTLKYQAFHGAPIPLAEGLAYSVQPATSPTTGELEHRQQRHRVLPVGARLRRDHRQPDRGLGDDEHEVARRPDAGRDADSAGDRLQRDVRAAAERRAEEGADAAR